MNNDNRLVSNRPQTPATPEPRTSMKHAPLSSECNAPSQTDTPRKVQGPQASKAIVVQPGAVEEWSGASTGTFRLAFCLNKLLPRGKGFVPRILGCTYYRNVKRTLTMSSGAILAVVPRALDSYVGRQDIANCTVTRCCKLMLKAGNVLFDVGANVGLITLGLATDFADGITVCAFEPQADLAESIALSCRLSGLANTTVYSTLVGEFDGTTEFFRGSVSSLASRAPAHHLAKADCVPIISLGSQVASGVLPDPDVVKIDVEGFTLQVLQGMKEIIRQRPPVLVFELGSEHPPDKGPMGVLSFLDSLAAYRLFRIHADPGATRWLEAVDAASDPIPGNYLAVPSHDEERIQRTQRFRA